MKGNQLVILAAKPDKFVTYHYGKGQEVTYPRSFLKRYYEMGVFDVENPDLLYKF